MTAAKDEAVGFTIRLMGSDLSISLCDVGIGAWNVPTINVPGIFLKGGQPLR